MQRRLLALLLGASLAGLSGCSDAPTDPDSAVFVVEVAGDERFRIRLTDPARIDAARAFLSSRRTTNVNGQLARGDGGFNRGYSWHLKPGTVEFVEMTIEVCDGMPSFVENELDYWVDTVTRYCPWGAVVVAEE